MTEASFGRLGRDEPQVRSEASGKLLRLSSVIISHAITA